jgi:hypothetical protein
MVAAVERDWGMGNGMSLVQTISLRDHFNHALNCNPFDLEQNRPSSQRIRRGAPFCKLQGTDEGIVEMLIILYAES